MKPSLKQRGAKPMIYPRDPDRPEIAMGARARRSPFFDRAKANAERVALRQ